MVIALGECDLLAEEAGDDREAFEGREAEIGADDGNEFAAQFLVDGGDLGEGGFFSHYLTSNRKRSGPLALTARTYSYLRRS